jgi:hypothetical protein
MSYRQPVADPSGVRTVGSSSSSAGPSTAAASSAPSLGESSIDPSAPGEIDWYTNIPDDWELVLREYRPEEVDPDTGKVISEERDGHKITKKTLLEHATNPTVTPWLVVKLLRVIKGSTRMIENDEAGYRSVMKDRKHEVVHSRNLTRPEASPFASFAARQLLDAFANVGRMFGTMHTDQEEQVVVPMMQAMSRLMQTRYDDDENSCIIFTWRNLLEGNATRAIAGVDAAVAEKDARIAELEGRLAQMGALLSQTQLQLQLPARPPSPPPQLPQPIPLARPPASPLYPFQFGEAPTGRNTPGWNMSNTASPLSWSTLMSLPSPFQLPSGGGPVFPPAPSCEETPVVEEQAQMQDENEQEEEEETEGRQEPSSSKSAFLGRSQGIRVPGTHRKSKSPTKSARSPPRLSPPLPPTPAAPRSSGATPIAPTPKRGSSRSAAPTPQAQTQ